MVAFERPLLAHPPRAIGIFERVVERQEWYALVMRNRRDEPVEPADPGLGVRPPVVPGQHVGEQNAEPELLPAAHHRTKIRGWGVDIASLGQVVDSTLDDQDRSEEHTS